jgi:hypothetical protein
MLVRWPLYRRKAVNKGVLSGGELLRAGVVCPIDALYTTINDKAI